MLGATPGRRLVRHDLSPSSGPVCVTGATGFIALHTVKQLLAKGYEVVACARSVRTDALPSLAPRDNPGRLRIVEGCDLLKPGSFDTAIDGCAGVFHMASPFYPAMDRGEGLSEAAFRELVMPAVLGTQNVLDACSGADTVRRVVLTSSFGSIINPNSPDPRYQADATYDDSVWNMSSLPNADLEWTQPDAGQHAYRFSKTMAEHTAWQHANHQGQWDMVCVNPPPVLGFNLGEVEQPQDLNESSWLVYKWLTAGLRLPANSMAFVEVRDVASSHLIGYEKAAAGGCRFLCTPRDAVLWSDICSLLESLFPDNPHRARPTEVDDRQFLTLDPSRLEDLGMTFLPALAAVRQQVASIVERFPEAAHGGGGPEAYQAMGRL
jgi:nucleoside-diphosphate-sugar epimerase